VRVLVDGQFCLRKKNRISSCCIYRLPAGIYWSNQSITYFYQFNKKNDLFCLLSKKHTEAIKSQS
jgi:hypothetical protein